MLKQTLLATAVALCSATAAHAQEALVLSTGGARGIAHAGALLGLEELGYDPDLVIGNSMGAVVGALYASGRDPDEIRRRIEAMDWDDLFMPKPLALGPGRALRFPVLRVGLDLDPLEVSQGFTPDWRVNRLLVRLLFDAGVRARGDFDRLPRRFRAVGTDLASGKQVVLGEGDLARAVRVSMGTPGFFSPLEWDGLLLADGGIADHVPVALARELGAERVIAVDVSTPPPEVSGLGPVELVARALGLLMRNARPDTTPPEVLIRPDIDPGFAGAVFPDDPSDLIELGLATAREAGPAPPGEKVRDRTPLPPPAAISRLDVEVGNPAVEALARSVFRDVPGRPYDPETVLRAVDHLYASSLVAGVWPRIEEREGEKGGAGEAVLVLRLDTPPRTTLSGAAGYDNDRGGRAWAAVRRRTAVGARPLQLTAAVSGDRLNRWIEASARLHSLRFRRFQWSTGAYLAENDARVREGEERAEIEVRRLGGWLGIEHHQAFGDWGLTASGRVERVEVEGGGAGLSAGPFFRIGAATPDGLIVGVPTEAEAELRVGEMGYGRAAFRSSVTVPGLGMPAAAVVDLALTEPDAPPDALPALGDDRAMPGLPWGHVRGRARIVGGFDLAHPTVLNGFLRLRLRGGSAPRHLGGLGELDAWMAGAAVEGVWSSPLGPVLVGFGMNDRGSHRIDVNLGPRF